MAPNNMFKMKTLVLATWVVTSFWNTVADVKILNVSVDFVKPTTYSSNTFTKLCSQWVKDGLCSENPGMMDVFCRGACPQTAGNKMSILIILLLVQDTGGEGGPGYKGYGYPLRYCIQYAAHIKYGMGEPFSNLHVDHILQGGLKSDHLSMFYR